MRMPILLSRQATRILQPPLQCITPQLSPHLIQGNKGSFNLLVDAKLEHGAWRIPQQRGEITVVHGPHALALTDSHVSRMSGHACQIVHRSAPSKCPRAPEVVDREVQRKLDIFLDTCTCSMLCSTLAGCTCWLTLARIHASTL